MEYVDGETVYDQIVFRGNLGEADALPIIEQVAKALMMAILGIMLATVGETALFNAPRFNWFLFTFPLFFLFFT